MDQQQMLLSPPTQSRRRTIEPKAAVFQAALANPLSIVRESNKRSLYDFIEYFWPLVSPHPFKGNWHIRLICKELEALAVRVGNREPRPYDLIINVPPGMTKTITCSIMFPAWCWTRWHWMRFICASYSGALALESAEYCRELIRSDEFQAVYPELTIKEDKDTKSNFRVVRTIVADDGVTPIYQVGGSRYSTSVGGTLTGFHGDILIVDDPLNPQQAASEIELATANSWCGETLSTRKTDKDITPTVLIMQRLHQNDPSGNMLGKKKNIRNICLPGDARLYKSAIKPPELYDFYVDDLLDPQRLPQRVLDDLLADLGQYGYAGQIGQSPTPPGGGMFKVDSIKIITERPGPINFSHTIRYWDKAGTEGGTGAFTCGVKMSRLVTGRWLIEDVIRGRWSAYERERKIRATAEADGRDVEVYIEQEPGSGGKESAESTIRNLAGFVCKADRPTGDKIFRADPFSVQVNSENVMMMRAAWNKDYLEELRFFPYGTYKDQVDASSGAFGKLAIRRIARRIT